MSHSKCLRVLEHIATIHKIPFQIHLASIHTVFKTLIKNKLPKITIKNLSNLKEIQETYKNQ